MGFLPEGYQKPASNSRYLKFEQGENKFRILSDAIIGYIDWKREGDKKVPVRTKEQMPQMSDNKPKHFWSFVVWDYTSSSIKILEITQTTIQSAIYDLHADDNWGDPKGYDLNVVKKGEKMETKYNVIPTPPKDLAESIKTEYAKTRVDLNKLYSNEDPFIEKDGRAGAPAYPDQRMDEVDVEKALEDISL